MNSNVSEEVELLADLDLPPDGLSPAVHYTTIVLLTLLFVSGIVGSILTLTIISRKSLTMQTSFRKFMIGITMAEMAYNFICIPRVCILMLHGLSTPHPWVLYLYKFTTLVVRISSFFSDISATFLAFERYVSLKAPVYWHSKSVAWKSRFSDRALTLTALASLPRTFMEFHSSISEQLVNVTVLPPPGSSSLESSSETALQRQVVYYTFVDSPFSMTPAFQTLTALVSVPVPFCIILLICYFTIHGTVMMHRLNTRIADRVRGRGLVAVTVTGTGAGAGAGNHYRSVTEASMETTRVRGNGPLSSSTSATELNNMWLISMLSSCSTAVCQVGYIYSTVVYLAGVDFPSPHLTDSVMSSLSLNANREFYKKYLWFWIVSEGIARSNLFFLYYAFSRSFRQDVKLLLTRTFAVKSSPPVRGIFRLTESSQARHDVGQPSAGHLHWSQH